eukprot:TRINITY_DN13516_c0_g1_i1.p1 TRINITY_DN13516_c0_g1~~TRINITY_DN13516_c0_g1_i1.p1  ORF type:complete len:603 (+),score=140.95 TRINITY_DN13516_c0_g1_i1:212-1810(+)
MNNTPVQRCPTEGESDHSGWVLKSVKNVDDKKVIFEKRYGCIYGGYLSYSISEEMSQKGVVSLAGVEVSRVAELPSYYQVNVNSTPPSSPSTPNVSTPLSDFISPHCPSPDEQSIAQSPPTTSTVCAPDYCLLLSGFAGKTTRFTKDVVLVLETEQQLKEWRDALTKGIAHATKLEAENDRKGLSDDNTVMFDKDKDGDEVPRSHLTYKKPELSDFELVTVVGRGSFGKVLKVKRKSTDQIFAMKILQKEAIIKDGIIDKVVNERNSLAGVSHPFLSSLEYAFQTEGNLYLVMPFLPGGDLKFHMRSRQQFTQPMTVFYTAQLVLALEHLHSRKILYRDLKPGNIVLDADGYAVLTDFGMAKRTSRLRSTSFCGTDTYMAPEMIDEKEYTEAVDWWSLGILVYELLVGDPPFYAADPCELYLMITQTEVKYTPVLSSVAKKFIKKLLTRDETKRLVDPKLIKADPFFNGMDWDKILKKELPPPFKPNFAKGDTRYFDAKYTNQNIAVTKAKPVPKKSKDAFMGFSYPRLSCS